MMALKKLDRLPEADDWCDWLRASNAAAAREAALEGIM